MPFPRKIIIDDENCRSITNLSMIDLISLTGIFGYAADVPMDRINVEACYYETNPDLFEVSIKYDQISLVRNINNVEKYISNESFVNKKECCIGIGCRVFLSQLKYARNLGFKRIDVIAMKANINSQIPYVGHLVWAKLGFSMSEDSQKTFRQILKGTQYENITHVYDLVHKNNKAANFWNENGETWHGSYDLTAGSDNDCMTYFYSSKSCSRIQVK